MPDFPMHVQSEQCELDNRDTSTTEIVLPELRVVVDPWDLLANLIENLGEEADYLGLELMALKSKVEAHVTKMMQE